MTNILVLTDSLEDTDPVIKKAVIYANAMVAKLWILHVGEPDPAFVGYESGPEIVRCQVATKFKQEHHQLQEVADQLRAQGISATALLIQGPTIEKIMGQIQKLNIDLVIAGLHKHGRIYKAVVGSTVDHLLKVISCPILLIPISRKP